MSDNSAIGLEGMIWTNPLNNKFFAIKEGEKAMTVVEEDESEVVSDEVFVVAMVVEAEEGKRFVSIEQDVSDTEEGE